MLTKFWEAFVTFNTNGLSYLLYTLMNNWWFILLSVGVIASIAIMLREEIENTLTEEQQIL